MSRTAALVAALVRRGPSPLTALAAEAGCTPASAFRILHTLSALGLVAQDGKRGPWRLGLGWLPVARAAVQQGAVMLAAYPILRALSETCGEAVSLVMRDGEQCEVVAAYPPDPPIRAYAAMGERGQLHAGPGRLLLAYAPEAVQRAVLASRLPRLGPGTRTVPARIAADLPGIRSRAWLVTADEIGDSAVTVSVAVQDGTGTVIAVLSVVSPALRMRPPRPHTVLVPLLEAAKALQRPFG